MSASPVIAAGHVLPAGGDSFGHVEVRGIDWIPQSERHGHPRELLMLWASSNVTYLYVVLGGVVIGMGLTLAQAALAIVLGNLWWFVVGLIAASGPASGRPSYVVMRALFGVRANRINVVLSGWGVCVGYGAINLSVGSLATDQLLVWAGVHPSLALRLVVVVITPALTLTVSIFGHATMVRCAQPFTAILALCMLAIAAAILPHIDWAWHPAHVLTGWAGWGVVITASAVIASNPLSWTSSADFARYLPADVPVRDVLVWTALGGFIPAVLLALLGALAGTVANMADPQVGLSTLLPGWLTPVFLAFIALSSITNNIMTAYSSGISLQAAGVRLRRSLTVLADGLLAFSGTVYALFVADFLTALGDFLALSVAVLGPGMAIYATDLMLRHNRYDGIGLGNETRTSPYWYWHGISPAGVIAQLLGTAAALSAIVSKLWTGPIATAFGGTDFSCLIGPLVAGGVYALLMRRPAPVFKGV
jgi:purine-cytosine permease-like protein